MELVGCLAGTKQDVSRLGASALAVPRERADLVVGQARVRSVTIRRLGEGLGAAHVLIDRPFACPAIKPR